MPTATRVPIPGRTLLWAQQRSGLPLDDLVNRFPQLPRWIEGASHPTLKQLQGYATATSAPIGYFFLPEPPDEPVPLPDFRTKGDRQVRRPSPNLLETIFDCQRRQEWFREHARATGEPAVDIVGSHTVGQDAEAAGSRLRTLLDYAPDRRGSSWADAFRRLRHRAEEVGILVMTSGIVGSNSHRKLDPDEFRGFSLVDDFAPLVFVNGADTKAAQIFTLAHEMAHILIAREGLDDLDLESLAPEETERWCNRFAAEFLVPADDLEALPRPVTATPDMLDDLAGRFRVSTLVILRRLRGLGLITDDLFYAGLESERARIRSLLEDRAASSGGNFYATQQVRTGSRFTRSLIESTLEGQTLYRDAFQMLGLKKQSTFNELATRLGVA